MGRIKKDLNKICKQISEKIHDENIDRSLKFMEVCGTHTMSFFKFGLGNLLPNNIKLISGPGCPVCVTDTEYIDKAIYYMSLPDVIITTFGDMVNVPGSRTSIFNQKAKSGRVRIVYSPLQALELAKNNPTYKVVFLAVGFETTVPIIASTIIQARKQNIDNFYILCGHKLIPPAMSYLLESGEIGIDGFLCPGHVSAIIGMHPYKKIVEDKHIPCVIAGFDAHDIMMGIYMLLKQVKDNKYKVENEYNTWVHKEGNTLAQGIINEVFEVATVNWRGLDKIPGSGLRLKKKYLEFNIEKLIPAKVRKSIKNTNCICGDVIKGIKLPIDCRLFSKACRPNTPKGPCMVSSEGACSAYYKYAK